MKRAKLSRPKSTDRGGGILKYVQDSAGSEFDTAQPDELKETLVQETETPQETRSPYS